MADQLPDATKGVANYIDSYLDVLKSLLDSLDRSVLENVTELLFATWKEDRRLILCGNGGSGSTSSHLVCDFQKNIYLDGGKPFEVVALTDSPALLLAWGNDTSFENVFAGQARTWVRKNDVLIAISGSGNSKNVLEAVKVANHVGATTIGFCGYDGGKRIVGRKRRVAVDTDGRLLMVNLTPADVNAAMPAQNILAFIPGTKHGTREVFDEKMPTPNQQHLLTVLLLSLSSMSCVGILAFVVLLHCCTPSTGGMACWPTLLT